MIDNDVEEITFGDDFARPCALIIFLIFFIKTIFSVVEKDYYFAIILSVVGVCLTGIFILLPKAPRKILINKKNGVIDIVNYYPAKDLCINVEDISRVDWGGGRDPHSRFGVYFFDHRDEIIFSFIGYAVSRKGNIDSIEDLPNNHRNLLEVVQNLIKKKNHAAIK